jgi:uncharacterized protein (DUF983 family)
LNPTPVVNPKAFVPAPKLLWRGLTRRCPVCGGRKLFEGWFKLKPRCLNCDYDFEREPGWWIGAIIMNTAAAMVVFAIFLPLGVAITWPHVPWNTLTVVGVALMVIVPVVFYPISKTLWLALDIMLHRMG